MTAQINYYSNGDIEKATSLFEDIHKCHQMISDEITIVNFFNLVLEKTNNSFNLIEMNYNARFNIHLSNYYKNKDNSKSSFYNIEAANKFQEIGDKYNKLNLIIQALKTYKNAFELYSVNESFENAKQMFNRYIDMNLTYFRNLVISANLNRYTFRHDEAVVIAWQSLKVIISMISEAIDQNYDLKYLTGEFLKMFEICKLCLLCQDKEENVVVSLKLDELQEFLEKLADDIPDNPTEVSQWLAIQIESIKFMIPQASPQFMLVSADGRLIHFVEAKETIEIKSDPGAHLSASLISVARMMFIQTSFSGSSLIKEISMSDSTILIDNRENFILIGIVSVVFDGLKEFLSSVSDEIQNKFDLIIRNWPGDNLSITPVIDLFDDYLMQKISSQWNI